MHICLNPDDDFVKEMKKAIKENNGYCPCSPNKTKDTKCMCKDFKGQTTTGYCHCGLYYKENDQ